MEFLYHLEQKVCSGSHTAQEQTASGHCINIKNSKNESCQTILYMLAVTVTLFSGNVIVLFSILF